jgi:chromate reductase, NAD(P)H dehydrogenase (quinone)
MDKINVLVMVGGIGRDSLNKKLFKAVKELAPKSIQFDTFDLSKVPFFSQDLEIDPPDNVLSFKEKIREADAVLFITPEYNRSIPGVLKNAIDWGSRPFGQNLWDSRPAAVMGASPGKTGTFGAQHHLRQVLVYLNMRTMAQPECYFQDTHSFDEKGNLQDKKSRDFLTKFLASFEAWILDVGHVTQQDTKHDGESNYAH